MKSKILLCILTSLALPTVLQAGLAQDNDKTDLKNMLPNLAAIAPRNSVTVSLQKKFLNQQELYSLEDELISDLSKHDVGNYDGNLQAIIGAETILYFFSDKPEQLILRMRPILLSHGVLVKAKYESKFYNKSSEPTIKSGYIEEIRE